MPSSDRAGLGQIAGGQRKPGNEADAVRLAIVEHVLAAAIDEVVAVLHRRDLEDLGGGLDVGDRDFAQAGMADDAVVEQRLDRAELLVARHLRIDAVQLPQIDLLDAELLQALDAPRWRRYSGRPSGAQRSGPGASTRPWSRSAGRR